MATINPYLNFNGNTEEVFNFYKSVFGGEFAMLMRYAEAQGCDEMPISDSDKSKIMHVALPIGTNGDVLMGTDALESMPKKLVEGNNFSIAFSAQSRECAEHTFGALADGGNVEMPLQDTFWGAYFGMCRDKFGVNWMVSFDEKYAPLQGGN